MKSNSGVQIIIKDRIRNYEDLGLGLFVHWGLYSLLGKGEWVEMIHKLPKKEYEKLSANFFAESFDSRNFVKLAKKMGAKYITLTTKHHEGFYLYDTKGLSEFDSFTCGPKRDLVREFVEACNDEEILPFFYMATYDWHTELFKSDFSKYLEYLKASVEILCKNYGKVGGFWFDGNWSRKDEDWELDELYRMIRSYQPSAIIINNTGLEERGKMVNSEIDVVTYERGVPESRCAHNFDKKHVASEVSMTLNEHWGYAENDLKIKSIPEILENITYARKVGANILLNVPLKGNGEFPPLFEEYMKVIGQWMEIFGEAYYLPKPTSIVSKRNEKDFVLRFNNYLYFFIHDMQLIGDENVILSTDPIDPRTFMNVYENFESIQWIDDGTDIEYINNSETGIMTMSVGGYKYGTNWVIRVARAKLV